MEDQEFATKDDLNQLSTEVKKVKQDCSALKQKVYQQELHMRKQNVELTNIAEQSTESPKDTMRIAAEFINEFVYHNQERKLELKDLSTGHRLGAPFSGKRRNIIIRLALISKAERLVECAKVHLPQYNEGRDQDRKVNIFQQKDGLTNAKINFLTKTKHHLIENGHSKESIKMLTKGLEPKISIDLQRYSAMEIPANLLYGLRPFNIDEFAVVKPKPTTNGSRKRAAPSSGMPSGSGSNKTQKTK